MALESLENSGNFFSPALWPPCITDIMYAYNDIRTVVYLWSDCILCEPYPLFAYIHCRMNTKSSTRDAGELLFFLVKYSAFACLRFST